MRVTRNARGTRNVRGTRGIRILALFILLLFLLSPVLIASAEIEITRPTARVTLDARAGDAKQNSTTVNFEVKNLDANSSTSISVSVSPGQPSGINLTIGSFENSISAGGIRKIPVTVKVAGDVSEGTHSGKVTINSILYSFDIEVDRLIPAKLAPMANIDAGTVVFDKPKSTMQSTGYVIEKSILIINEGDATMSVQSVGQYGTPDSGITFTASPATLSVSPKNSAQTTIKIKIPVTAPEGTLTGKIQINAGKAGSQNIPVTIVVKHEVKLEISSYSSDFGNVDLLESIQKPVTLKETLGYKSIQDVSVTRNTEKNKTGSGKDDWLLVSLPSQTIPAGGSVNLVFTLRFRGETGIGQSYDWGYIIATSAGDNNVYFKAVARPVNTEETKSALTVLSKSSHTEISHIASQTSSMLTNAGRSNLTSAQWVDVATVSMSTASFLGAMGAAEADIASGDHFSALDWLTIARISADTVDKSTTTSEHRTIEAKIDTYLTKTLTGEAAYFTGIAESTKDSDIKESLFAYDAASRIYNLLGNTVKGSEFASTSNELLATHDEYVKSANDRRVDAKRAMRAVEADNLYRWDDVQYLVNPFKFDSAKEHFDFATWQTNNASEEYKLAGEDELYDEAVLQRDDIAAQWTFLKLRFISLMAMYIIAFMTLIIWSIFAMQTYTKDCDEEDMGNVLLLG